MKPANGSSGDYYYYTGTSRRYSQEEVSTISEQSAQTTLESKQLVADRMEANKLKAKRFWDRRGDPTVASKRNEFSQRKRSKDVNLSIEDDLLLTLALHYIKNEEDSSLKTENQDEASSKTKNQDEASLKTENQESNASNVTTLTSTSIASIMLETCIRVGTHRRHVIGLGLNNIFRKRKLLSAKDQAKQDKFHLTLKQVAEELKEHTTKADTTKAAANTKAAADTTNADTTKLNLHPEMKSALVMYVCCAFDDEMTTRIRRDRKALKQVQEPWKRVFLLGECGEERLTVSELQNEITCARLGLILFARVYGLTICGLAKRFGVTGILYVYV